MRHFFYQQKTGEVERDKECLELKTKWNETDWSILKIVCGKNKFNKLSLSATEEEEGMKAQKQVC